MTGTCASDVLEIPVVTGNGIAPARNRPGDAAFDLRAQHPCTIPAQSRALVDTGIRMAIPEGFAGLVVPRSGLALKHGITVLNGPGLIDPNYRGTIGVVLYNTDACADFEVAAGDRIAQLLIVPAANARLRPVDELGDSDRGDSGFGSSGVS